MYSRIKTIEVTKAYCHAFNERDLTALEAMMDPKDIVFARQGQPTIVGAAQIIRRTTGMLKRHDDHAHHIHMVNAIMDIKDTKARPCILGMLDGERHSVVVISCKPNGLIQSIAILMGDHNTSLARPIEPLEEEHHKNEYHEVHKHQISDAEIEERKLGLKTKAKKLRMRLEEEGATPALLDKFARLEKAEKKLEELIAHREDS